MWSAKANQNDKSRWFSNEYGMNWTRGYQSPPIRLVWNDPGDPATELI